MEQANNELYVRRALSKFACMLDTVFCMLLKSVTCSRLQHLICLTLLACHQLAAADVHEVSRRLFMFNNLSIIVSKEHCVKRTVNLQ